MLKTLFAAAPFKALVLGPALLIAAASQAEARQEAAAPQDQQIDSAQIIAGANAFLNGVESLQARFLLVDPTGKSAEGSIYLRRPGRVRFEYDPPSPLLIVADGQTVAIQDYDLETVDRAPLRSTPLWWLLKLEIDLASDARIVEVGSDRGLYYLTLEDPEDEQLGRLVLMFDSADFTLREWYARDMSGQWTQFVLSEISTGLSLDPRLFVLEEDDDRRRGRRGR